MSGKDGQPARIRWVGRGDAVVIVAFFLLGATQTLWGAGLSTGVRMLVIILLPLAVRGLHVLYQRSRARRQEPDDG